MPHPIFFPGRKISWYIKRALQKYRQGFSDTDLFNKGNVINKKVKYWPHTLNSRIVILRCVCVCVCRSMHPNWILSSNYKYPLKYLICPPLPLFFSNHCCGKPHILTACVIFLTDWVQKDFSVCVGTLKPLLFWKMKKLKTLTSSLHVPSFLDVFSFLLSFPLYFSYMQLR